MPDKGALSRLIKAQARHIGFEDCGIAKAEKLFQDKERLQNWLDQGMHGTMQYMENHFEKRTDPRELVDKAKSVISVILNYYSDQTQQDKDAPIISKYAYGEDYHFVVRRRLNALLKFIREQTEVTSARAFVDSAPVLDRAWAARAGIGWIGKNTNLISPQHGSFVFIGSIILDIELNYDNPINDYCGGCNLCIKACPTDALVAPRVLDSRKCISYLTIENRGSIDNAFKGQFANRVFGCDICQDVCPWNRKAKPNEIEAFKPKSELLELNREQWQRTNEDQYKKLFKKSAVKRAKYSGLKRNIDFLSSSDAAESHPKPDHY